jgi:hypothetical protein
MWGKSYLCGSHDELELEVTELVGVGVELRAGNTFQQASTGTSHAIFVWGAVPKGALNPKP